MKKAVSTSILFLLTTILLACGNNIKNLPNLSAQTPTPFPELGDPTLTSPINVTDTKTTEPVLIVTATNVEHLVTNTPISTLSTKDERKFWLDLILPKANCNLPCFIDLTPGMSSWADLFQILSPVGIISSNSSGEYSKYVLPIFLLPNRSNPLFQFYGNSNVINGIYGKITIRSYSNNLVLDNDLINISEKYYVKNLFIILGKPTQVLIGIPSGPYESGSSWIYEMWILYEQQNILLHYSFTNTISRNAETDILSVCPTYSSTNEIEIFVSSSDVMKFVITDLNKQDFQKKITYKQVMPFSDSTNLTIDDFYSKILTKADACFETPRNIWP